MSKFCLLEVKNYDYKVQYEDQSLDYCRPLSGSFSVEWDDDIPIAIVENVYDELSKKEWHLTESEQHELGEMISDINDHEWTVDRISSQIDDAHDSMMDRMMDAAN